MKTSLWVIIALVTGIVGFLMGYSISSTTGVRSLQAAHAGPPSARRPADAPGAAGAGSASEGPAGYGSSQAAPAAPASGAPQAAPASSSNPRNAEPSAAGY
jgi:hypothetical protein